MAEFDEDEMKRLIKEGVKDWLNDIFLEVGRWTIKAVLAALVGAAVLFILKMHGWTK